MDLTTAEKIKLLCKRAGMSLGDLAEKTGQSRQNLSNKFARNDFVESDLRKMAEAMGCTYSATFHTPNGDTI